MLEGIDRGLYAVDEWLRFRGTEGPFIRVCKTIAGVAWGGVAYVVRFIVVLFIEPQINPIKHFPVVTISHKLLLPMIPTLAGVLIDSFGFETAAAGLAATIVIGKIPGVFGFLVWELKENWRLYRANRRRRCGPWGSAIMARRCRGCSGRGFIREHCRSFTPSSGEPNDGRLSLAIGDRLAAIWTCCVTRKRRLAGSPDGNCSRTSTAARPGRRRRCTWSASRPGRTACGSNLRARLSARDGSK